MRGLIVEVLKHNNRDCSNGGISSKSEYCLLVGSNVPEVFEAHDYPVVTIVERKLHTNYLTAYPVDKEGNVVRGTMAGGCFIYSSDSRFRKISEYPVPLHDRHE